MARVWFRLVDGIVYLVYHPDKHTTIDSLDKGIADVYRGFRTHRRGDTLATCENRAGGESSTQVAYVYLAG